MNGNPLIALQQFGQSIWYDNIRRGLITAGDLRRLIEEDGLRGVTSNPTIFEKAISGSTDYDAALHALVTQGKNVPEIYETLAIEDIQLAADLFRPVYEATEGRDGYVSLEVSPHLAHDTERTIAEARRLFEQVGRPNAMIKVPATPEGIPAIEGLIGDGININITLIFSQETYMQVAEAYLAGLERRARDGQPIDRLASVASVFVSRIDTAVDKQLEARMRASDDPPAQGTLRDLLGKAAIANAKLIYAAFKESCRSPRFMALQRAGARVQRPLWASTGTKNPHLSDVYYVEALIGPDTVNTMPPATLAAFRDHGNVRATLEADVDDARFTLQRLAEVGVDLGPVTQRLQDEGVGAFAASFDQLLHCIAGKREMLRGGLRARQTASLGQYHGRVQTALKAVEQQQLTKRLWEKDVALWARDAARQRAIKDRLGWLHVTEAMLEHADDVVAFAREVNQAGFRPVVLLGMGGSSLAPEVCRLTFDVAAGHPDLLVLDSTDPGTILSVERGLDLARTLFIVSSKSGTTIEPLALFKYFYDKVQALKGKRAGEQFVAITDPGTPLEQLAWERRFRRIFLNPSDIGGRYSALSHVGLVPAALLGIDIATLLDRAERMQHSCVSCVPVADNPGVTLGVTLATLAQEGRDKVTFVLSPPIASLGTWVEQLLAESTGKAGKGLVPVEGEPLSEPSVYGADRLFVSLQLKDALDAEVEGKLQALEEAGHPVIRIMLDDPLDLGQEFFRWEIATAVAGARLEIDPFDEPNVQESKDQTHRLLAAWRATGILPQQTLVFRENGISLYADAETLSVLNRRGLQPSLAGYLAAHLSPAQSGDYLALMAYLQRSAEHHATLQAMRVRLRQRLRVATTLGYGPRFLHSTGQLHKGGANNGLFIQLTADDRDDLAIPGEPYTFSTLKQAQALGDFQALRNKGRYVIRVHLGVDVRAGLEQLRAALAQALPS